MNVDNSVIRKLTFHDIMVITWSQSQFCMRFADAPFCLPQTICVPYFKRKTLARIMNSDYIISMYGGDDIYYELCQHSITRDHLFTGV